MKKKVLIVDEQDNVIGAKARGTLLKDDIYRVSALWIINSNGDILLAKRSKNKTHHPDMWGPAVAGTVDEGETYEQNIVKEAEEELGIANTVFILGPKIETNEDYHHFTQWYILHTEASADSFTIQVEEVQEVRWFTKEELNKTMEQSPEDFLPTLPKYISLFN